MKIKYSKVTVIAPARLHMGFIDLSGSLGRYFGSVGLALNEINTRLTISLAHSLSVSGPSSARARRCAQDLCAALQVPDTLDINIESAIPEHIGLGSGTQMSLAIGTALNKIYGLGLSIREIAELTERGARSGIGIGVFEQGGLFVDGGRGEDTVTPPVIVHMDIPEDWRFILVFDARGKGLHGEQEIRAFSDLPPFPQEEAARLCYLLMMQGLPALVERDIIRFGEVITQLQISVGEHFAAAQGGVFTSPEVAEAITWLADQGAVALGQTSWGPTGFCAVQGVETAARLVEQVQQKFFGSNQLRFVAANARNSGGDVLLE